MTVIHGDTSIVQYGIGTFGSRATAVGGTAVFLAIAKLKEKATQIAAHMLGVEASSVSFSEGTIRGRSCERGRERGRRQPQRAAGKEHDHSGSRARGPPRSRDSARD